MCVQQPGLPFLSGLRYLVVVVVVVNYDWVLSKACVIIHYERGHDGTAHIISKELVNVNETPR